MEHRKRPEYWSTKEVAAYLHTAVDTLYQWRSRGYGPAARRVGGHLLYDADDVVAWVQAQAVEVA
jgi:excisionase family DNA binding protein